MFMSRQPTPPVANLPDLIVQVARCITDPKWLKDYVQAAQSVTEANVLTEEEAQRLLDAQQVIEEAAGKESALAAAAAANEARTAQLKVGEGIVAKREQDCDARNTALGEREKELTRLAQELGERQKKLDAQAAQQKALDETQRKRAVKLDEWESEMAEEQKRWDDARKLVAKKAG